MKLPIKPDGGKYNLTFQHEIRETGREGKLNYQLKFCNHSRAGIKRQSRMSRDFPKSEVSVGMFQNLERLSPRVSFRVLPLLVPFGSFSMKLKLR